MPSLGGPKFHRMVEAGRCLWRGPSPAPCSGLGPLQQVLRAVSSWDFNISKDEDSGVLQDNLLQCSTTRTLKAFFLTLKWNFLRFSLSLHLEPSVGTTEKSLAPSSLLPPWGTYVHALRSPLLRAFPSAGWSAPAFGLSSRQMLKSVNHLRGPTVLPLDPNSSRLIEAVPLSRQSLGQRCCLLPGVGSDGAVAGTAQLRPPHRLPQTPPFGRLRWDRVERKPLPASPQGVTARGGGGGE